MTAESGFNTGAMRAALLAQRIEWRKHALQRMAQRNIGRAAEVDVLQAADIIQVYFEDRPYPSALFLGFDQVRPLHVVAAVDESTPAVMVISVYEPDLEHWLQDYRTRIRQR